MLLEVMKKKLVLLSSVALALASCTEPAADLSGTLTGVESDTLLVFTDQIAIRKHVRTDTVPLVNNSFKMQLPDTAVFVRIVPKPSSPKAPIRMFQGSPIVYFPGDKLHVEGAVDDYTVSGSVLYEGIAKYPEIKKIEGEIHELNNAFSEAYKAKNEAEKSRIKKEVKEKYEKFLAAKYEVVKASPDTYEAAYFATQLQPKEGLEAIELLSEDVKKSSMYPLIKTAKESYEKSLLREKSKASIVSGNKAPDFKFTTLDGKQITLASFKGKYLLVDFWGTWCGWCIKGIPAMKAAYAKHRAKVEFLGVCCGDTDQKWRASVAHHELPWVNVLEGDSQLSARYAVGGFPTKVLIDPDGKIVEVFMGESPELYKKLDQLFVK